MIDFQRPLSSAFVRLGACVLLLSTAACGGDINESLGMTRVAPDEFTVVSRPSLSVPPEFTLRPPHPGEAPRTPSADTTAHNLLLGDGAPSLTDPAAAAALPADSKIELKSAPATVVTATAPAAATTGAEASFLKRAGADAASDDIRNQLTTDEARPNDTSSAKSLLEKVNGANKAEPVVDAKKEAERLRNNKDSGKPANEGDVPVEPVKQPTVLDRVF